MNTSPDSPVGSSINSGVPAEPVAAMTRREFGGHVVRGLGAIALASSGIKAFGGGGGGGRKPNIVWLFSDQHAYNYCGFMGHKIVKTPNLDRIAKLGVVFQNTYCGNPVCCPSRSGTISGVYPSDVNSFCNTTAWDGSVPAWPALLRDAGYKTFGTGKMDASSAGDLGFDESPDLRNDHDTNPDVTGFFRRPLCFRTEERNIIRGASRTKRHADGTLADATVAFIRRQKGGAQPWAAYCGVHQPHPGFVGLEKYYNEYLKTVDMPPELTPEELESMHPVFMALRNFKNLSIPVPAGRIRSARAAYYAMISEVDEYAGEIWKALEETGQLDNTIFVYSSDHGEALGLHGLWLKNNLYDCGARVPLVMAGPGLPKGATVATPVMHVDLIRTFIEEGGAKTHSKLRGHSLVPLANGQAGAHPGWAYSESHSEGNSTGSFMIRKGDWKYIHFTYYPEALLFNIAEDPGERKNRFHDPSPEVQAVIKDLRGILHSQVDPVEVTERAFATQRKRMERFAVESGGETGLFNALRGRLGDGQAMSLVNNHYGRPIKIDPSKLSQKKKDKDKDKKKAEKAGGD